MRLALLDGFWFVRYDSVVEFQFLIQSLVDDFHLPVASCLILPLFVTFAYYVIIISSVSLQNLLLLFTPCKISLKL